MKFAPAISLKSDSALSPFKQPIFAAMWWANLVSNFGGVIQGAATSWLMTDLAPSPQMVALVQTSSVAPIMLFSLFAGALADLYDRRKIMLWAQIAMGIASGALAAMAYLHQLTPSSLLILSFIIGTAGAIHLPSWQASVRDQVPREDIGRAVGLNAFGFNVARSVGPGIAGFIVAYAGGASTAFFINAFTYIGLIVVLARWRPPVPETPLPREPFMAAVSSGLRYVSMSPSIVGVLVRATLFGFAGASLWALLPLVAHTILRGGPLTYGLLFGAFGIGAMIGALLSARVRAMFGGDRLLTLAIIASAISCCLVAVSPWVALTGLAMALAGAAWVVALSSFNVAVQTSSPRWVAGRVLAVYQIAAFGGLAVGSAFWGFVGNKAGLPIALFASGVLMLATLAAGLKFKLPSNDNGPLDPWQPHSFTAPALEMQPRSGPIAVSVAYRVNLADAMSFQAAMHEMGRVRQRDGARRWSLTQDIDDPTIWVEHFHTPTWLEHQQRLTRLTIADESVRAKVLQFHQGDTPPKIQRMLERPPPSEQNNSLSSGDGLVVDGSAES